MSLRNNLTSLKIHWSGPHSESAFRLLRQVSTLRRMVVVISKTTSDHLTRREKGVRKYFKGAGTRNGQNRLADTLGFDELLKLRGLDHVRVEHISKAQSQLRTNDDRHTLEVCLTDMITTK